jgi:hypothetical protein
MNYIRNINNIYAMKYLILIIVFLNIGCRNTDNLHNVFNSKDDTLVLKTYKNPGIGIFPVFESPVYFRDTSVLSTFQLHLIFPDKTDNIKVFFFLVDGKSMLYKHFKEGKYDTALFNFEARRMNIDTSNLPMPENSENTIYIMTATKDGSSIIIVDENNNADFRDDSIRKITKLDIHSTQNLIKCRYRIYNGSEYVIDSTWINIGTKDSETSWLMARHLSADFSIDDEKYQMGLVDYLSFCTFDRPLLALLEEKGVSKDSLTENDLIERGEYLKLKDAYYKFDNISNDGNFITLIKEKHYELQIGTQPGLIAPDFKCITTDGDTIKKNDYKNKLLLIANTSGCAPGSYYMYKQLIDACKDKIIVIGVEYEIKEKQGGIIIDASNKFNRDFYEKYRQDYSSYNCYLIDSMGRISNKFRIFDWEKNLKHRFENR